jgi:translation elongation factor EF-G
MREPTTTPVLWLAIDPKTDGDREKLDRGLQQLMAEDATLRVETNQQTGQTVIGAVGKLELEVIIDRLFREFGVGASIGRPQVAVRADPNINDDDRDSLVGAPLKPVPTLNESGVALPEPDDDGLAG